MSQQAILALQAVEITHRCGRYAGRKYAAKRGVLALWRLAMQLEASNI